MLLVLESSPIVTFALLRLEAIPASVSALNIGSFSNSSPIEAVRFVSTLLLIFSMSIYRLWTFFLRELFSPLRLTDSSTAESNFSCNSLTLAFASDSSYAIYISLPTWSSDTSLHCASSSRISYLGLHFSFSSDFFFFNFSTYCCNLPCLCS